jgi:hypothetical protein
MKKKIKYTIIDTRAEYSYSDYLDFCNANGFTPAEEGSDDYWEYVGEMRSMEFNDEMDNIKFSKENDAPVIVTGTLGLWNGDRDIYPVVVDNLHDAVEKCIGSSDDAEVVFEDGVIYVYGYHHDGTNRFTIEKLSAKGMKSAMSVDGTREREVKKEWVKKFKAI